MDSILLVATMAARRVAIACPSVRSVIELEGLTVVPGSGPHVAGLTALRSRVITVIDCRKSLGIAEAPPCSEAPQAIVVQYEGHDYALVVDTVDDVIEAGGASAKIHAALGDGWDRVALGMVETPVGLLLMVDPGALIAGMPESLAA